MEVGASCSCFWRTGGLAVVVEVTAADEAEDAVPTGEKCAMADPGLAGRFFEAKARFCANMASLKEGLEAVMVLLERPMPGRAPPAAGLGELVFPELFCRSFLAVASRSSIILREQSAESNQSNSPLDVYKKRKTYASALAGHISLKVQ